MQPYMAKRTSTEANENPKATSKALKNAYLTVLCSISLSPNRVVFKLPSTKNPRKSMNYTINVQSRKLSPSTPTDQEVYPSTTVIDSPTLAIKRKP